MENDQPWFVDDEIQEILDKFESDDKLTLPEIKLSLRLMDKLPMAFGCYVLQEYLLGLIDRIKDE